MISRKRATLLSWLIFAGCAAVLAERVAAQTPAKPSAPSEPNTAWPKQAVRAPHGMVVTDEELASQSGVEVLKRGGNAVDAAVATGFALAVVHPDAGNIGGGGFMLIRLGNGELHFLDYREKAPGRATERMYQDSQGNVIPNLSLVGYKASGVPGSVKGMVYAERTFGKLG